MIVGGRDYTCGNENLDHLYGNEKKIKCNDLVKQNKCPNYKNYIQKKKMNLKKIFNIEDI